MENIPQNPEQGWPEMKPSNKKWLSMVLIIAALVGGYFAFAKYQSWWPFGVKHPNSNRSLQEYRSQEFGYEFSYDKESGLGYNHIEGGAFLGPLSVKEAIGWADNLLIGPNNGPGVMYIKARRKKGDHEINLSNSGATNTSIYKSPIEEVVNGHKFLKYETVTGKIYNIGNIVYSAEKNGVYYLISVDTHSDSAKRILATFKFIEPSTTSDWKTYRNEKYGYSIQYPPGWSVLGDGNIYGHNTDLASITIRYYSELKNLPLNPNTNKPYDYFDQYVMESYFFKDQKQFLLNSGVAKSATLVLDPAIRVMLVGGNGHFYEVGYQPRYNQTPEQLDRILSTFKLIESSAIADWKTYQNEQFSFEFKYPPNFKQITETTGALFQSQNGHFWVYIENDPNFLDAVGVKDAYYKKNEYGFKYQDSFPTINERKYYKQARYDLGVLENYYLPQGGSIFKFAFEFNFKIPNQSLETEKKEIISKIISTFKFIPVP